MKVTAINSSPRKHGNTERMLNYVLAEIKDEGIETELITIGGQTISGCRACGGCGKIKNKKCVIKNDIVNDCIDKIVDSEGLILGSPTYFADVTAEMKAFIDRIGYVSKANGGILERKVGLAVAAARRGGAIHTFDSMNHLFTISGMFVVGGNYWNDGIAGALGEIEKDTESIENMKYLGQNMAWLLKKIHA